VGLALPALVVVLGLAGLVFGADRFVFGASSLARRLGVSPLLVGMLIIGLGTSAPEMLVSATAALEGKGGIALGNAVGSNITNIGLVLGVSAVIKPIELHRDVVRRELPVVLVITALVAVLIVDGSLTPLDGCVLVGLLAVFLFRTIRTGRAAEDEDDKDKETPVGYGRAGLWLAVGLALLVASSRAVVWGGSTIATALGVSDLIVGLTIVAIGTSLPELAASAASAFRGEHAMAIGNVLGSNVFNLLAVLPFPALLDPGPTEAGLLERDYVVMGGLTLLLMIFAIGLGSKPGRINRVEGGVFTLLYAGYVTVLVLSALGHV
jgi:cation:H+ antiporter